jgi:DNA polymerase-4
MWISVHYQRIAEGFGLEDRMSPDALSPCVAHLDADAFFAAVEQRDDPRLRGRPVAVGTGVVASCSYESRRWGVRTGMRLSEARRLCPSLVVLAGDYRRYEQAGRRMLAICLEQAAVVEAAALDDLYLDLRHCCCGAGFQPANPGQVENLPQAAAVVRALGEQIREEVGLAVSAGVGSGKLVARVGTLEAKRRKMRHAACGMRHERQEAPSSFIIHHSSFIPPSVVVVPRGGERDYLAPWPARVLPGLGSKGMARLERLNVSTVGEVAALPAAVLCGLFGRRGRVLREQARGIDPRPVQAARPPQSVSRRTSFEPPAAEWDFVRAMLDHLLERAASWLRFRGVAAGGLTLTVQYGDYRMVEGRIACARPTNDEGWLKEAARERLGRLCARRLPLRLLGVALAPLQAAEGQAELFPDPQAERRRRLEACKDAVRQRYGFMALLPGSALVLAGQLEHDRENFRLRTPCLTR